MREAQARAASGGYNGARFPWESAYTGAEVTPDICIPCRENQQHITSDIAFVFIANLFVVITKSHCHQPNYVPECLNSAVLKISFRQLSLQFAKLLSETN